MGLSKRQRLIGGLSWTVLGVWLCGSAWALWSFESGTLRPFVQDISRYSQLQADPNLPPQLVEALRAAGAVERGVTLVHIGDPGCHCDRMQRPRLDAMVARLSDRGLRLVRLDIVANAVVEGGDSLAQALHEWLPPAAVPAALVIDGAGRVAYFGPYSSGSACYAGDLGIVERAIESALGGSDQGPRLNLLGQGCYCPWPAMEGQATRKQGIKST